MSALHRLSREAGTGEDIGAVHPRRKARTPTLIQHGENDRRVPIANAYELRQGLEDRGVPAEMIVYKGFGHGINKPKQQRAVMEHNYDWFSQWIWGEKPVRQAE